MKKLDTDFHDPLEKPVTDQYSILYLNVRNFKKNSESFLSSLDFSVSETWCDDLDNFIYDFPNYAITHQKQSITKVGSDFLYL